MVVPDVRRIFAPCDGLRLLAGLRRVLALHARGGEVATALDRATEAQGEGRTFVLRPQREEERVIDKRRKPRQEPGREDAT